MLAEIKQAVILSRKNQKKVEKSWKVKSEDYITIPI